MHNCVLCQRTIGGEREDYVHRGSCGHHQCMPCALPMIRAGKGYCPRCPAPVRATGTTDLGNLVLGNDVEQNRRVAAALRAERKVSPLADVAHTGASCADHPPH